jgi:protein-S-isoprenylcysteine O-methyltransferase Ste14
MKLFQGYKMTLTPLSITLAVLLVACSLSFTWGMRSFFVRPARMTTGMRTTAITGSIFAALHLAAILLVPHLSIERFSSGTALYSLSLLLFWRAVAANRAKPLAACFSTDRQSHITRSGPYRVVRHPFYCSYLLAWMAGWLATGSIWLGPTVVAMFAIYLLAALREEARFAQSALAGEYAKYRLRTGMFFPIPSVFSAASRNQS